MSGKAAKPVDIDYTPPFGFRMLMIEQADTIHARRWIVQSCFVCGRGE